MGECAFAHGEEDLREIPARARKPKQGPLPPGETREDDKKVRKRGRKKPKSEGNKQNGDDGADDEPSEGASSEEGPDVTRMRRRVRKKKGPDGAGGLEEFATRKRGRSPKVPSLCPWCGSTIASHLGYRVCSICRV